VVVVAAVAVRSTKVVVEPSTTAIAVHAWPSVDRSTIAPLYAPAGCRQVSRTPPTPTWATSPEIAPETGSVTETAADPDAGPTVAAISTAAAPVAVNSPAAVTDPPPLATRQSKAGWLARASPNWSYPAAANCTVWPSVTVAVDGVTAIVVSVWLTSTFTVPVTVDVPSDTATANVYRPAASNVTAVSFAALVPLAANAAPPPDGTDATDQV
jgi:hypothetical protein